MRLPFISFERLALVCAIALAGLAVVSAQTAEGDQHMDTGSAKMLRSPDVAFADKATRGGIAEIELGQLAAEKGTSPDVKGFGQQMINDHTRANDTLKGILEKETITLPTNLTAKDQALKSKLQNLSGAQFDKTYIKAMAKDHRKEVKELQKEAKSGKDLQIKNFAAQTLPTLQAHLDRAKTIQAALSGKATKK